MNKFIKYVNEKVSVEQNSDNEIIVEDDKLGIKFIISKLDNVIEVTFGNGDFKEEYKIKDISKIIKSIAKYI